MSAADALGIFLSDASFQDPAEARWTRMVKTTYADPLGVERTWESAERTVGCSVRLWTSLHVFS